MYHTPLDVFERDRCCSLMFTHSPEGSDLYVGSLTDCGGVDKVRSRDPSHHTRGSGI